MFELIIIAMLSFGADAATANEIEPEYCDPTVWGRWCDPSAEHLTIDYRVVPYEHHAPDEIEALIFGID